VPDLGNFAADKNNTSWHYSGNETIHIIDVKPLFIAFFYVLNVFKEFSVRLFILQNVRYADRPVGRRRRHAQRPTVRGRATNAPH